MQALTALVLGAFVAYAGSWYLGFVEGNFALLLFMASVVSGGASRPSVMSWRNVATGAVARLMSARGLAVRRAS